MVGKLGPPLNLILAMIMSDDFTKADSIIESRLQKHPKTAKLYYLRAFGYYREQDHSNAVLTANLALDIEPQLIEALNIRGVAQAELGQTEQALTDFQSILAIKPDDLNALQNSAERLNELGEKQKALALYEAMLKIAPHHSYALRMVASLCEDNKLENLAKITNAALDKPKLMPAEKADLSFASAVVHDRQGDPAAAMKMYDQVHAIDKNEQPYSSSDAWSEFKHICAQFPAPLPNMPTDGINPAPIFVVGLPRSGTTLVEMILTTSPLIQSFGELLTTRRLYKKMFRSSLEVQANDLSDFAQFYRNDLIGISEGAIAFVDKMPANFCYIGLLLNAFPNARIINVQRDPRDVALSMWKKRFKSQGMFYASKLSSIADQANLYQSYMKHWNAAYPEQILSIKYETLVKDIATVSRQMADHCAIQWSESMLRPDKNTNKVITSSINQVREKVHSGSVGRWTEFGDNLTNLTSKLDPKLWPEIV